jgi:hypothetical protein
MTKFTTPSSTRRIIFSNTSAFGFFVYEPIKAPGKFEGKNV